MRKYVALTALLLCAVLALSSCGAHFHSYVQTIVPSTCRSMGYTLFVCDCGDRQYRDYAAFASHEYGEWHTYAEPSFTAPGEEQRVCVHCGNMELRSTALTGDTPSLFLTAGGDFAFVQGEEHTQYKASLQLLGGENGEKPGFVLSAICHGESVGMDLGNGATETVFLDPCTPDRTYARANTADALWQSSISLRRKTGLLPAWVPAAESHAVTVRVFMENVYAGLYRLISRETLTGETAGVIYTAGEAPSCLFEAPPSYEEGAFSLQFYGGETPDAVLESFDAFSKFVRDSSPQQFCEELENYADLTALMDYFILCHFFGMPTGDTAGTVWSTTDGIHWTPSFDSLNNAFGLSAKGYQSTAYDGIPPTTSDPNGVIVPYTGKNLLWKKLCAKFPLELRRRYQTLRDTFLTKQNVCDLFLTEFQSIPDALRKAERNLYPALPGTAWASRHVEEYVQTRLLTMDQWLYPMFFSQPS